MKSYKENDDDSTSKNESNNKKENNANLNKKIDLQKQHEEWPVHLPHLQPIVIVPERHSNEVFESIPSRKVFSENNFLYPLQNWFKHPESKKRFGELDGGIGSGKTYIFEQAAADAIAIQNGKRMGLRVTQTRNVRSKLSYIPVDGESFSEKYSEYISSDAGFENGMVQNISDTASTTGSKIPNSTNTLEQATRIVDEMMRFASYDDAKDVKHYVIASVTPPVFEKVSELFHEKLKKQKLTKEKANNIVSKLWIAVDEGDFGSGCGSDRPDARGASSGNASPSKSVLMNALLRFQNKQTEKISDKKNPNINVSTELPPEEILHDGCVVVTLTATPSVNMKCNEKGEFILPNGEVGKYEHGNADIFQTIPPVGVSFEQVNENSELGFNKRIDMIDKQAPIGNAYYLNTLNISQPRQFKPVIKEIIKQKLQKWIAMQIKYPNPLFRYKPAIFVQFTADDANPRYEIDPVTRKKVPINGAWTFGDDDIPMFGIPYSIGKQMLDEISSELANEGFFKELGFNNNDEYCLVYVDDSKPRHYINSKNPEGIHTKNIQGKVERTFKKDDQHEDLFNDLANPNKKLIMACYINKLNRGVSQTNVDTNILCRAYNPDPKFPFGSAANVQACRGSRLSVMFDYDGNTNTWALERYYNGELEQMIRDFPRRYGHTGISVEQFIAFVKDTNQFDMYMLRRNENSTEDNQTKSFDQLRKYHLNSKQEFSDYLDYVYNDMKSTQTFVNQGLVNNQNGADHEVDVLDALGKILKRSNRKNVCVYYDKHDALVASGYKFPANNVEFSKFPTENYREELYNLITKEPVARKFFDNKQRTKYDTDIMITIDDKPVVIISGKCSLSDSLGSGGINNCSKLKKLLGIPVVLIQRNPISTDTDSIKSKAVFCSETSNLANIVAEDFAEMLESVFLLNLHNDSLEIHPHHKDIAKPFYPFGEEFFKNLLD